MTKSSKRILFYSAILAFIILSSLAVIYAQGYKYSFKEKRFLKTGSLFLAADADYTVFINNENYGSAQFISHSYSARRLLPGDYEVVLAKKDYYPWQKTIRIEEGLLSEFSRIKLFGFNAASIEELKSRADNVFAESASASSPGLPDYVQLKSGVLSDISGEEPKQIASNVISVEVSPDSSRLLWRSGGGVGIYWLKDTNYQPYHLVGDMQVLSVPKIKFNDIRWFEGGDHVIIRKFLATKNTSASYYIMEIDNRGGVYDVSF